MEGARPWVDKGKYMQLAGTEASRSWRKAETGVEKELCVALLMGYVWERWFE